MSFDWKSIVSTVAPLIGTALGGPMGGMAAKVVSQTLLGKEDATEDELIAAVMGAPPEQLLLLKEADQKFKVVMKQLGIDEQRLVFEDKDSARKREAAVKDKTPAVLAYVVTVMFTLALGGLYFVEIPEANKSTIYLMLGSLGTVWIAAMAYYHGTSRSSARKDEIRGTTI